MRLICPTCGSKLTLHSLSDMDVVAYCKGCGVTREMELKLFSDEGKVNRNRGRDIEWLKSDQGIEWLKGMVSDGATQDRISDAMGITRQTLFRWAKKDEEIRKILRGEI